MSLVDVRKYGAKIQVGTLALAKDVSAKAYALSAVESKTEDGGVELEFTLAKKPLNNVISVPLTLEGAVLYYQPPLTEEFNPADCVELSETHVLLKNGGEHTRPENVVGSYAVYHATKRNGAYKTGKICHIYRPKLIDADGKTAWAEYNRDAEKTGQLIITLPQKFLDEATYPVVVDPTFGYTSIGASTHSSWNNWCGAMKISSTEAGTLTKISAYFVAGTSGNGNLALYDNNGEPNNRLVQGTVAALTASAWNDFAMSYVFSVATLWLAWGTFSDGNSVGIAYDSTPASDDDYIQVLTLPASGAWGNYSPSYRSYSIYASYTTGATMQTVTDSIGLSDSVLRHKTLAVSDGVGASDLARTDKSPLVVTDALSLVDAILRNKQFAVTDAVALADLIDVIKGLILKTVTDSIGLQDAVLRDKVLALIDAVSLSDAVSTPSRVLQALDAVGLADGALVNKVLQVTESISLAEVVEVGVGGAKKTKLFLVLGDLAIQLSGD